MYYSRTTKDREILMKLDDQGCREDYIANKKRQVLSLYIYIYIYITRRIANTKSCMKRVLGAIIEEQV